MTVISTKTSLGLASRYVTSFHAYPEGNLSWQAAWEVEYAAYAVHAKIWQELGAKGDAHLRQSYHQVLQAKLTSPPKTIVDLGCGVGMSTWALQAIYPQAQITGKTGARKPTSFMGWMNRDASTFKCRQSIV